MMDRLAPPPNGSPDEIQAWNNMMDTMVTFIKASTHLMNTMTQKVHPLSGATSASVDMGCEPECAIYKSIPECQPCAASRPASTKNILSNQDTHPRLSNISAPRQQTAVVPEASATTTAPASLTTPGDKSFRIEGTPERPFDEPHEQHPDEGLAFVERLSQKSETSHASDKSATRQLPAQSEALPPSDQPEAAPPSDSSINEYEQLPDQSEAAPPPDQSATGQPPGQPEAALPSDQSGELPGQEPTAPPAETAEVLDSAKTDQPTGDADYCPCAAIRSKRLEEQTRDSCVCRKEDQPPPQPEDSCVCRKEDQPPPQPEEERVCDCSPTASKQAEMVQEMAQRLANAQQEIGNLQAEMARLQRMDTTRKTAAFGGPNPAVLYREIMRDSQIHGRSPSDRSSQRISPNVQSELFSINSTGNAQIERTDCPRYPNIDNARRRLFQSNTTGSTGFDMTPTPSDEGPPGFTRDCVPCEVNRISCPVGTPSAISATSRSMQRPSPMQRRTVSQGPTPQRYLNPSQPTGGVKQGLPNRTAPQYVGGLQAPCRRNPTPGGGSGFRSLPPGYQDFPNDPSGGLFGNLQSYQNMPGAAGGSSGFRDLQSYQDPSGAPSRRIVICGPPQPQQQQNNCSPNCQKRRKQ